MVCVGSVIRELLMSCGQGVDIFIVITVWEKSAVFVMPPLSRIHFVILDLGVRFKHLFLDVMIFSAVVRLVINFRMFYICKFRNIIFCVNILKFFDSLL